MSEFSVLIGLGTNLGDRTANLEEAKNLLGYTAGFIAKESRIYKTAAWGITDQPEFLNQVVLLRTNFYPFKLLDKILEIERTMGRVRMHKWGERLIDIDILFFENFILTSPNLVIPHPFIQVRNFVLKPLLDIRPDFLHPVLLKTILNLYTTTPDESKVLAF